MEDDDEFGDLYTDVLRPFQSTSSLQPAPVQSEQPSPNRLNLNVQSDDEEILYGVTNSNPKINFTSSHQNKILVLKSEKAGVEPGVGRSSDSGLDLNLGGEKKEVMKAESLAAGVSSWTPDRPEPSVARVLQSGGDVKLQGRSFEDPNLIDESGIDVIVEEESDDKDDILIQKDEVLMDKQENFPKFDIEEVDTGIGDMGSGPLIPGISRVSDAMDNRGEGDDWDSDSEDDLQIVLNDNNHGPMVMDRTGLMGSDDEDEDGDPLVIVADSEPGHQPMEEHDWGDEANQAMDGERKELGDAAKANGGVAVAPKMGYSNHTYHPYHSQFKYVRPGATPMPVTASASPGGAPGQIRPPVGMSPVAGRGRGDWRPPGMKNASPMQKSFHTGFGMPVWGNNTTGRNFGNGLEFTLPSHKTIFDIDIDSFEEKPWRIPGIDLSDYFNFSLNEESWKDYCKQLEQLRLETTMQSKIRVYESGRAEQEYDPDLPPELAAAVGIHDVSFDSATCGKMDVGQSDISKGATWVRPQLPTGRAIQVETGYGERLPSIDTRPPRIRDSDAIIEIILQDSSDADSSSRNGIILQPQNDHSREVFRGGHEIEGDVAEEDVGHFDGFPHACNSRKREQVGRTAPFTSSVKDNLTEEDGILPLTLEAPVQYSPNSRGKASAYPGRDLGTLHEERRTKGRAHDRSPSMTRSESKLDKIFLDNQKEDSVGSIGRKHSPHLSSPVNLGSAKELDDVEHGDGLQDELVLAEGISGMDKEETALDATATDTCTDENPLPSVKKQKLSSRVEQSSLRETDEGGDSKAARSSENSKARSGSSRDYQKLRDSVDDEVVQHDRSTRMGNLKRRHGEDEQSLGRGKGSDERHGVEKHHLMEKNRDDSYSRREWDPYVVHRLHGKPEGIDRRKERENSEGAWQRRDVDPHSKRTKAEDTRMRERGDEIGSRHRSKVLESSERTDRDEHLQLRKQLDNGNLRGRRDKEVEPRRGERDDNLKMRYENVDDLRSKGRREEDYLRRDAEKEEILHGHRENTSRSKRERDEGLDVHKRDDQVRMRDDDHYSARHKEESWIQRERGERQRERDELHRIKQSHEESLSKREKEEGRGVRSGRAVDDKSWTGHARVKDEYKGSDRDYHFKDTGRRSEQHEKRDRLEDGRLSQHRGREDVHARRNQLSNDEKRSRQERTSARSDRSVSGSDNNKLLDKKLKESTRKSKEFEGGDQNSMAPSKRNQEHQSSQMNEPVCFVSRHNNMPFFRGKSSPRVELL
ncbi:hypothetical protein U1Q18_036712 [Sarracenia purpurea var. burkii]